MRRTIIGVVFFLLAIPSFASAQVVINEIAWMGSQVAGVDPKQEWRYEWLELYNTTDQPVNLTGWSIELYNGEQLNFTIALWKPVAPHSYTVVGASDKIENVDMNYATLSGKFANSGQHVMLKNAAGETVEEIDAREGWFGGDNEAKFTMERRFPDEAANDPENWGSSLAAGGTPRAENTLHGISGKVEQKTESADYRISQSNIKEGLFGSSSIAFLGSRQFAIALVLSLVSAVLILALKKQILPRLS